MNTQNYNEFLQKVEKIMPSIKKLDKDWPIIYNDTQILENYKDAHTCNGNKNIVIIAARVWCMGAMLSICINPYSNINCYFFYIIASCSMQICHRTKSIYYTADELQYIINNNTLKDIVNLTN